MDGFAGELERGSDPGETACFREDLLEEGGEGDELFLVGDDLEDGAGLGGAGIVMCGGGGGKVL